ncbi:MAG: AAA family ATPase [Pseudomonadota bacterium]
MTDIAQQSLFPARSAAALPREPGEAGPDSLPLLPPQPKTVRETGLDQQLIAELVAKAIFIGGKTHLPILTTRLRLSINVLREILDFMVAEQLLEVAWRGESDIDVQYQLTTLGKQRAAVYLERCPYAGPAPVTLDAYRAMAERQAWRGSPLQRVGAEEIGAVFGADWLEPAVLDVLGAAMHSGRSLLLYGPSGAGKSRMARKLGRLLQGLVAVPYAVVVGQEIVQLYDPLLHLAPSALHAMHARQAMERRSTDIRWALCQRPVVQVGAELGEDMLDLRHDAFSGCYQAPPHFKANNGLFIVDDLGRQRAPAAELLKRFMQPLESGQDQLSLRGGHQFSVPFDVVLVFATNLAPRAVLDDAFLRRLGYKIHVGPLAAASYRALVQHECRAQRIACEDGALDHLLGLHRRAGQPLLAAYPRQLLHRVGDFAGYAGQPASLTVASLEQAWSSMFAGAEVAAAAAAPVAAAALCGQLP